MGSVATSTIIFELILNGCLYGFDTSFLLRICFFSCCYCAMNSETFGKLLVESFFDC